MVRARRAGIASSENRCTRSEPKIGANRIYRKEILVVLPEVEEETHRQARSQETHLERSPRHHPQIQRINQ